MGDAIIKNRQPKSIIEKQWQYSTDIDGRYAVITKYIGKAKNITVPSTLGGLPVRLNNSSSSAAGVFTNNKNIVSINVPKEVEFLFRNAAYAFYNCTNLKTVTNIPSNTLTLNYAFSNCQNITSIPNIPESVTSLHYTCDNCYNLTAIPNMSQNITQMYHTFSNCYKLNQVTSLPTKLQNMQYTFYNCTNLTQVPNIPNSINSMYYTFYNCTSLTQAPNIPNSVTSMAYTFFNCVKLAQALVIPNTVTSMVNTFCNCTNLTQAPNIPLNVTNMVNTFRNCTNLTGNIYIKSNRLSNTSMQNCFYGTSKTKNVYIPCEGYNATANTWNTAFNATYGINGKNGVTVYDDCELAVDDWEFTTNDTATLVTKYVGTNTNVIVPSRLNGKPVVLQDTESFTGNDGVFKNNKNIISVKFRNGVSVANNDIGIMFYNCENLSSVSGIPNTVNSMALTFGRCFNLTTPPTIPSNVTNLGSAFFACRNLTQAPVIPTNVTNMRQTFGGCYKLTSAPIIPANVIDMGATFRLCNLITTAPNIPSNVTHMDWIFEGCTNLTATPNIPNSVTNLSGAFRNCTNLTSGFGQDINTFNNVTDISYIFAGCTNLYDNVIQTGTQSILPFNVVNMSHAFENCTSLEDSLLIYNNSYHNKLTNMAYAYKGCNNMTMAWSVGDTTQDLSHVFENCSNIMSAPVISKSANITNMSYAFANCNSLTDSPNIPQNVTNMYFTFGNCTNLTGNIIMKSENINNFGNCFYNTSKSKIVYIPFNYANGINTVTYNSAFNTSYGINGKNGVIVYSEEQLLMNDWEFTTNSTATLLTKYIGTNTAVVVPATLNGQNCILANSSSATSGVFTNNKNITSVTFSSGVKVNANKANYMFYNCSNLKTVSNFPSTVQYMPNTFAECMNLTTVPTIPSNVSYLDNAFKNCVNMVGSIMLPNTVTYANYAFYRCKNITNIQENSVIRTFYNAAYMCTNCTNLRNVSINICQNLSTRHNIVLDYAFENCTNLNTLYFDSSARSGATAHLSTTNMCFNCTNLTIVNMPEIRINGSMNNTFRDCTNLTTINGYFSGDRTVTFVNTFRNCTSLTGTIDMEGISEANQSRAFVNMFNGTTLSKKVYFTWRAGYTTGYNIKNAVKLINGKNGVTTYVR